MNKNFIFLSLITFCLITIGLHFFKSRPFKNAIPLERKIEKKVRDHFMLGKTEMITLSSKQVYPTIFCLIKTHPDNIRINKTINLLRVWGHKCDNYRFVTLIPKEFLPSKINTSGTFEIFNQFYMIQPKGLSTETHDRLSLKVYYSMLYVYEKFPNYDWYHIVDDDAYVNIENFKKFLKTKNPKEPITYGFDINLFVNGGYHSGGPGFVLSNEAFIRVGKALKENIKNCPDSGIDDVDINACVRKYGGTRGKSADEQGRERFLVMSLKTHISGTFPGWIFMHSGNKIKKGIDCCADDLIAVHYMQARDVFRLDLAFETLKYYLNVYKAKSNFSFQVKFRDIARTYFMLEDIENGSKEYEKYMNYTT